MKLFSSLSIQVGAAILIGTLAGFLVAHPAAVGPEIREGEVQSLPEVSSCKDGQPGAWVGRSLIHSDSDLGDWIREACELASVGGLGFHAETDAPHLLLALERLTAADFPRLMERISQLPDTAARGAFQEWLLAEWSRRAPEEALAWTLENRPDRYGEAIEALARKNASAAWAAFQAHPLTTNQDEDPVRSIFSRWAVQDRHAALDALLPQLASGRKGTAAELGFFETVFPDRMKFPAEWLKTRDEISAGILEQQDANVRFGGISALMLQIHMGIHASWDAPASLEARRNELARWLLDLPFSDVEQAKLLSSMAQWDGARAAGAKDSFSWLWRTVPEGQRVTALASIVENWASDNGWSAKDPDACGRWLNEQGPLGPEFSGALKSFALHAAAKDPESGLAWAQQIADPAIRQDAVQQVKAQILKQWPHRAAGLGVGP